MARKKVQKYTQTATINVTAKRCAEENLGITAMMIRKLISDGQLPYNEIGNRKLIYFPNLIKMLEEGSVRSEQTSEEQL